MSGRSNNAQSVKRLRTQFPNYDDEFFLDVLQGCEGNVEKAISYLKSFEAEDEFANVPDTESSNKSSQEWPALDETRTTTPLDQNRPQHFPVKKSSSDTQVIQKGGSGSYPLQDGYNAYRSEDLESKFAQIKLDKPTNSIPALNYNTASPKLNTTTANDNDALTMKTYPPGSNPDYWNTALKNELEKYEIRNLLYKLVLHTGNPPKVCILMRGVPGSGKSHLSTIIVGVCGGIQVSADNYFIDRRGKYIFKPEELSNAHATSQRLCKENMLKGTTPIVIDNTNTAAWEMLPYAKMGVQYGYEILIVEPSTSWKRNMELLHKKNIHGIPKKTISKMITRFESVTVEQLLQMAGAGNYKPLTSKSVSNTNISNQFRKTDRQEPTTPIHFISQPDIIPSPGSSIRTNPIEFDPDLNNTCTTTSPTWSNDLHTPTVQFEYEDFNFKDVVESEKPPADDDSIFSRLIDQDQMRLITMNQTFVSPTQPHPVPSYSPIPPGFAPNSIIMAKELELEIETEVKEIDETGQLVANCIESLLEENLDFEGEKVLTSTQSSEVDISLAQSPVPVQCVEKSKIELANSLHNLFPTVNGEHLDDIFTKCDANIDWAIDVLLDGGYTMDGDHAGPRVSKLALDSNGNIDSKPIEFAIVTPKKKRKGSRDNIISPVPPLCSPRSSVSSSESSTPDPPPPLPINSKERESPSPPFSRTSSSNDSELFVPTDGENWIGLTLPPDFVNTLSQKYSNPFGKNDFSLLLQQQKDFKIKIPPHMAFQIFHLLCLNMIQKSKKESERFIQETADQNIEDVDDDDNKIIQDLMEMEKITSSVGEVDLKRIMELETRLTERETKCMEECRNTIRNTLANRLHINELCKVFPSMQRNELEIYYAKYGGQEGAVRKLKEQFPEKYVGEINRSGAERTPSPKNDYYGNPGEEGQNGNGLSSLEWREIANNHHYLTNEYKIKMKDASKLAPGASIYYLEMSRLSRENMKRANYKACKAILEECRQRFGDDNTLDLHRLFVPEAMQVLKTQIKNRREHMKEKNLRKLNYHIIFGKGKNSPEGPKVGPAVIKYLHDHNIPYTYAAGNLGSVIATLRNVENP